MGYIEKGKKYPSVKEQLKEIHDFFEGEVHPEEEYFLDYSMAIAVEVEEELNRRGMTQKDLAKLLKKQESEISKWLSGTHNLTLRSLSKISAALKKKVIFTEQEIRERVNRPVIVFKIDRVETKPIRFENTAGNKSNKAFKLTLKTAG